MPEYEYFPELELVAKSLCERYWLQLGHVDLSRIYFAAIEGQRPKKKQVGEISGITRQWVRQLISDLPESKLYCFAVWEEAWEELDRPHQQWIVLDALLRVDPANDGTIREPDVKEFGVIVEFPGAGPYWRRREILPDLLDEEPLLLAPPADTDVDEGSTF